MKNYTLWNFTFFDSAHGCDAMNIVPLDCFCLITLSVFEVAKKIFQIWITNFGHPYKFLSDNGGEFANEKFREMNEKLNVITATTAGIILISQPIFSLIWEYLIFSFVSNSTEIIGISVVIIAMIVCVSSEKNLQNKD